MTENLLAEDQTPPAFDPTKDYFQELVGEGKKFKTEKELARGKAEADFYIKTLELQKDELRNDYLKLREEHQTAASLREILDQMKTSQRQESEPTHTANTEMAYDPKQVESLISSKIQEHENTRREQNNFNSVKAKLIERFGNNYQGTVKEQIDNLGLSEEYFNDMARKSPAAVLRTLGLDQEPSRENFQTPPRSTQRSDRFSPQSKTKRTWAYYQDLKKSNPTLYLDPKTTTQMHKDYQELGSDFEDGDFHA